MNIKETEKMCDLRWRYGDIAQEINAEIKDMEVETEEEVKKRDGGVSGFEEINEDRNESVKEVELKRWMEVKRDGSRGGEKRWI